jgi:hypothetical protein
MSWVVDHATTWYVLLGLLASGFAAAWWVNRRPKLLLAIAAALILIGFVWLLTRLITTDRKQLELTIHAMADAVVAGKADELLKYLAKDFQFQGHNRDELVKRAARGAKEFRVSNIVISGYDVEKLEDNSATTFFRTTLYSPNNELMGFWAIRAYFIKEGGQWRLREVRMFNPVVNQTQEIQIPI